MTRYVCFLEPKDPDDKGVWYRLIGGRSERGYLLAKNVWPYTSDKDMETLGPEHAECRWTRIEYEEEDVPDWLWVEIAKQALTDEKNEGDD